MAAGGFSRCKNGVRARVGTCGRTERTAGATPRQGPSEERPRVGNLYELLCSKETLITRFLMSVAAVVVGLTLSAAQVRADYGVFTIENPTQGVVHYQVKWGDDGAWQDF